MKIAGMTKISFMLSAVLIVILLTDGCTTQDAGTVLSGILSGIGAGLSGL